MIRCLLLAVGVLLSAIAPAQAAGGHGAVKWREWSPQIFEEAAREGRYVLLHLGANWCHWCHVMEDTTYRDPAVLALIDRKFIPVRVEQDDNPEVSHRYEAWGWPATIMFDGEGNEIGKRRGYQPPEFFANLLQAIIDDPSALSQGGLDLDDAPTRTVLTPERKAAMEKLIVETLDFEQGGVGDVHRFIHPEMTDLALNLVKGDSKRFEGRDIESWLAKTLTNARLITDPVWGGVYQYSDKLDWSSPHYEKLMSSQAVAVKHWALTHLRTGDPLYRDLAAATYRFLIGFFRDPSGAFYVSQDADLDRKTDGKAFYALPDAERRKLGLPRIDRNRYARETGWGIQAMLAWFDLSGDRVALDHAVAGARWALAERRLKDGAFGHGAASDDSVALGDTLAMGEALLGLYRATGGREWLAAADAAGAALVARFQDKRGGYFVKAPAPEARGVLRQPVRPIEDNVTATRFLNRLAHYTGKEPFAKAALHGFAYLASLAENDIFLPGGLLAAQELERAPLHVTIVGRKDDPAAQRLHEAARRLPFGYARIDWWDRREGPMANEDVRYPELDDAAAFVCTDKVCSLPMFDLESFPADVKRFARLD